LKTVDGTVYVTADEMRRLDERTIHYYSVDVLSLMENAGLQSARAAAMMLGGALHGRTVACLAGKGNNGGDGLVAARHLHDWGADVTVVLAFGRDDFGEVPRKQLAAIGGTDVHVKGPETELSGFSLLVDALLGYNAKGDPRGPLASVIRQANSSGAPIMAIDLPSGLDPTTGEPHDPCVKAAVTLTLGLPKIGFLDPRARTYLGDLWLADISIPPEAYAEFSQSAGLFDRGTLVRIW